MNRNGFNRTLKIFDIIRALQLWEFKKVTKISQISDDGDGDNGDGGAEMNDEGSW